MQNSRLLIIFLALLSISLSSYNIYKLELERKEHKDDLIELLNVKYGLFNVDTWKEVFSEILAKKIKSLEFTAEQESDARENISAFLHDAINDLETQFHDEQSKSVGGLVKISVANFTDLFEEIKNNIPEYTEEILLFLRDPNNRDAMQAYIKEKLSEYADQTFSPVDYTKHDRILAKYKMTDRDQAIAELQSQVDAYDAALKKYLYAGLFIGFLCALGIMFTQQISTWEFVLYTLISIGLLDAGLILPMIEIDARIAEMSFTLLGEPVSFTDQILYYKSKSIIEVVTLMLSQGKPDVMFVGLLVLLFSVLFPISKMLASLVYIFMPSLGKNGFIRFMVFRTGKWSMADVMVIAIFMSFIGFSGILAEQLGQLEGLTTNLDVLTTNKSSLQDGFYLFTSFVILSLLISHRLQFKDTPEKTADAITTSNAESSASEKEEEPTGGKEEE